MSTKVPTKNRRLRVVILARASSDKQVIGGETLTTQADELLAIAMQEGWEIAKLEPFVESGRKNDRVIFDNLINFCLDRKNKIDIFLVKNIDRFTRQGSAEYLNLKEKLKLAGVRLVDAEGVIQGEKNTLERQGFSYDWSVYEPSRAIEIAKAEDAKTEARTILTRMISHEIRYVQQGYWNRNSVIGFRNQKIDTENDGRRNILVEEAIEAFFMRKMFELRGERKYSYQAIVDELNQLGFKTRAMKRRDKKSKKPIGIIGQLPLTVKRLQAYLRRTVYAGVIVEKWTHYLPVKAKFDGLVSIELFNKANEGKIYIDQQGDSLEIKKDYSPWAVKHNRRNPLYPYKNVVLCPECGKPLLGSASTGQSGQKFPAYHCSRGHKRFSQKPDELNKLVEDTVSKLQFSEEEGTLFRECFMLVFTERKSAATNDTIHYAQNLNGLKIQQESAYTTFKTATNPSMKARAEKEYAELEDQIVTLSSVTAAKEKKEMRARLAYKQAAHLMEHLEEVLIDKENVTNQEALFRLAFEELPTYSDLQNGTIKLSPLFKLKSASLSSKETLVTPRGIEPRFPG